jgi:POT family proton-dependent oligopeptide transporter
MEPVSPYKQAIGLFLLAIGYLIIAFGVKGIGPGVKVSMMWLVSLYTIHTFGELCLSPIGLSMVNKLAPVRLASLLMGVYFLANATANKLAGTLSSLYPETLVPTEVVASAKTSANANILKANAKISEYNGKQVFTMEMMDFSAIKNEKLRDQINIDIQKGSIVKEKEFVGVKVNDLYTFFMIFVVMAGVASIILFAIAGYMVKMMHGIR